MTTKLCYSAVNSSIDLLLFHQLTHLDLFLRDPIQDSAVHLVVMSTQFPSSNLRQLLSFCCSWPWHFWRVLVSYLVECFLVWIVWYCLIFTFRLGIFGKKRKQCCTLLRDHSRCCAMLTFLVIGFVNFDHLGFSQVSPLQCCYFSVINKYLVERSFETM